MKAFWFPSTNVGDSLTPVILEQFTKHKAEWVPHDYQGKLLLCGSILECALPGDTVLGAGEYREESPDLSEVNVMALRGKLSGEAPAYGDPAILLPLIYKPKVKITKEIGYIPHVWDQENYKKGEFIDVNLPWKEFVREVLACEGVVSSSLHGMIIAQAYGVPAKWVLYDKIPGAYKKYQDYLTGVNQGIKKAQKDLLKALAQL